MLKNVFEVSPPSSWDFKAGSLWPRPVYFLQHTYDLFQTAFFRPLRIDDNWNKEILRNVILNFLS